MVSVAVAQEDRPKGDSDANDIVLQAKCQFRSAGASGPIYACKDLKTGKVVNIGQGSAEQGSDDTQGNSFYGFGRRLFSSF